MLKTTYFDYEKGVNFGPLISKQHYSTVRDYIETGISEGARLLTGGEKYQGELSKGNFIPPTIFADVTSDMTIFQEEIFGPVVYISKFKTEEDAIELANEVNYGLAGAVFTNNIKRGHRVAKKIKAVARILKLNNTLYTIRGVYQDSSNYSFYIYTSMKTNLFNPDKIIYYKYCKNSHLLVL